MTTHELEVVVLGTVEGGPYRNFTREATDIKAALLYGDHLTLVEGPKVVDPANMNARGLDKPATFFDTRRGLLSIFALNPHEYPLQQRPDMNQTLKALDDLEVLYRRGLLDLDLAPNILRGTRHDPAAHLPLPHQREEVETLWVLNSLASLLGNSLVSAHPLLGAAARQRLQVAGPPTGVSLSRANRSHVATRLIASVPGFPAASVDEILDLRDRVAGHSSRFRAAVADMEAGLKTDISSSDFDGVVDDLYRSTVAPALEELRESVRNTGAWVTLARGINPTAGGAVALAVAHAVHAPVLAGITALGAGLAKAVADEVLHRHEVMNKQRANRFFLLHEVRQQLAH